MLTGVAMSLCKLLLYIVVLISVVDLHCISIPHEYVYQH